MSDRIPRRLTPCLRQSVKDSHRWEGEAHEWVRRTGTDASSRGSGYRGRQSLGRSQPPTVPWVAPWLDLGGTVPSVAPSLTGGRTLPTIRLVRLTKGGKPRRGARQLQLGTDGLCPQRICRPGRLPIRGVPHPRPPSPAVGVQNSVNSGPPGGAAGARPGL